MTINANGTANVQVDVSKGLTVDYVKLAVTEDDDGDMAIVRLDSNACRVLAKVFESAAMELDARAVR